LIPVTIAKQQQPNGTLGKKPLAASVNV